MGILIVGVNFGCGLSCEYVFWVFVDFGICVIVVFSFGEIFVSNCVKNGMLLVIFVDIVLLLVDVEVG